MVVVAVASLGVVVVVIHRLGPICQTVAVLLSMGVKVPWQRV
jgi:hypothetical protein